MEIGRNLIVCCDGTDNQFGEANTNVLKLFSLARKDDDLQLAFYDPGVGTFSATAALTPVTQYITKVMGSAFGYGTSRNIAASYQFLADHYAPNDRIFFFGFSRGAYIARALAALIHACGILHKSQRNLIPYAIELFKSEASSAASAAAAQHHHLELPVCNSFAAEFSYRAKIQFLGLWDTVKSVGTIYNPLKLPFTAWNPSVLKICHAVSIDERRKFFRQNLWSHGKDNVKQVWFAGVHADIGGGYPESENGLSKIALAWMVEEATAAGLLVDEARLGDFLPRLRGPSLSSVPDAMALMHDELHRVRWKLLQYTPRRYWIRTEKGSNNFSSKWNFSALPQPRFMEEGSWVHHTVFDRIKKDPTYRPHNLPSILCDENGVFVARPNELNPQAPHWLDP